MQVNSISRTNFGAKIIPSKYLNKAIDLAKSDAANGTKEGRKRAAKFYNSLRTIELDGSRKELSIDNSNKKLPPILKLDGTKRFIESNKDSKNNIAEAVQDSVNSMADSKYFNGEMSNDADKVDLKSAFDVWVK